MDSGYKCHTCILVVCKMSVLAHLGSKTVIMAAISLTVGIIMEKVPKCAKTLISHRLSA